jgi:hypothetical protein
LPLSSLYWLNDPDMPLLSLPILPLRHRTSAISSTFLSINLSSKLIANCQCIFYSSNFVILFCTIKSFICFVLPCKGSLKLSATWNSVLSLHYICESSWSISDPCLLHTWSVPLTSALQIPLAYIQPLALLWGL